MNPVREEAHWRWLALLFIAFLPGSYALPPAADNDLWWHLRAGEWIWTHQAVTTTDPFSRPGIDEAIPWMSYSWLYELLCYGTHSLVDPSDHDITQTSIVLKTAFNGITFLAISCLLLSRRGMTWRAIGVLALAMIPCSFLMTERPWHFTIWGTIATLAAVDAILAGRRTKWPALLPLAYVIWANVHIQFVLGLGILGLGFAEAARRSALQKIVLPELKRITLLGIACTLATLVNPYHFRLWIVVVEYATQTAALRNVMELLPPDFADWRQSVLLVLFALVLFEVVRRGFPAWECLLFAACVFFSLRMRRDIWFGAITSGMILLPRSRSETDEAPGEANTPQILYLGKLTLCLLAGLFLTRMVVLLPIQTSPDSFGKSNGQVYPVEATRWLKAHPQPGPIFNHFDWGGFFIWELREYPVAIDGRTNLFGEERLLLSFKTWSGLDGWDRNPDLLHAGFIVAPASTLEKPCGLTEKLLGNPNRWRVLYQDETAIIFSPVR